MTNKRFIRKDAPLCTCGCGKKVKWAYWDNKWNKFLRGHHRRGKNFKEKPLNLQPPLCKCGCRMKVEWCLTRMKWNKYIRGHQNKGSDNYMFGKIGIANPNYGKKLLCVTGEKSPNKRIEKRKAQSERMKGKNNGMYGRTHSKEVREAQSKRMEKNNPAKIPEVRKSLSKRMENGQAAYMNSFIKNPSKPQLELFELIKQFYPNAILNYSSLNFSIDIAIINKNIAIEYDGSYWHNEKKDKIRQKKLENIGWNFLRYKDYIPTIKELEKDLILASAKSHCKGRGGSDEKSDIKNNGCNVS